MSRIYEDHSLDERQPWGNGTARERDMSEMVDIEYQDDRGSWNRYSTVPNEPTWIAKALQVAEADNRTEKARVAEKIRPASLEDDKTN